MKKPPRVPVIPVKPEPLAKDDNPNQGGIGTILGLAVLIPAITVIAGGGMLLAFRVLKYLYAYLF